jgi:radical SAM protein with 4Fe4S-binding SPASM domain
MTSKTPVHDKMIELGNRLFPTNVFYEVTHRCNGNCGYCYIEDRKTAKDLDTRSVFRVLDKCADAGVMNLIFTGGEMFIRPDILDILNYTLTRDFWFLGLMTNGTLLTKEHMDFIIGNKAHFGSAVSMSAFSHVAELNDSYFAIPGALAKICENARYLLAGGVEVDMKLSVLDFNVDTIMDTRAFFEQQGCTVSSFVGALFSAERGTESLKRYSEKEFMKKFFRKLPASENEENKKTQMQMVSDPELYDLCAGRFTNICIDNRGNIKPCIGFLHTDPCNILESGTLRDILSGSRSIREARELSKKDIPECSDCYFVNSCTVCLADMNQEHGSYCAPPSKSCNLARAIYEL